jgi:hypothetical protein
MVLILANNPGDVALIAILQPICHAFPAIIARASNVSILYACQDYIDEHFAPGKPSQHGYFRKKLDELRDSHIPQGMNEVSRLFTTNLTYLEMAAGPLPEKIVEDMLDATLTHSSWRDWVDRMHMETLRQTARVDRHHTWQLVLSDIKLRVDGDPSKDPFRHPSSKRTATQAGYSNSEEPFKRDRQERPGAKSGTSRGGFGRSGGNRGRSEQSKSNSNSKGQDNEHRGFPRKQVQFEAAETPGVGRYGPGDQSDTARGHCNRCWATDHWAAECKSDRCFKCGAPIKGAVYHNATICSPNHQPGSRSRRDAATGRRGGRGPRGGRGN